MSDKPTAAQVRLLERLANGQDWRPTHGAALYACDKREWIGWTQSGLAITPAGRDALRRAKALGPGDDCPCLTCTDARWTTAQRNSAAFARSLGGQLREIKSDSCVDGEEAKGNG